MASGLVQGSIRVVLGWCTPESQLELMFGHSTGEAWESAGKEQGRSSGGNCLQQVVVVVWGCLRCVAVTSQLSLSAR